MQARNLFDAALRLEPNLVFALRSRSTILDFENDVDPHPDRERIVREMDDLTSRAIKLDATDPLVWDSRRLALADGGRWKAALEASDQAIRLDPYSPHGYVWKAWTTIMTGRPGEALTVIERAMALNPDNIADAMRVACEANLLLGREDDAVVTCEKAAGVTIPRQSRGHSECEPLEAAGLTQWVGASR